MVLLGRQIVILLEQCSEQFLKHEDLCVESIGCLVESSGLHIVKFMEHRFDPFGLTLIWILAESHLAIHTWPEYGTILVDLFVCQDEFDVEKFVEQLRAVSGAASIETTCAFEK